MRSMWRTKALRVALLLAIAYLLLLAGVFLAQRRLLYFPTRLPLDLCLAMAERAGFEPWRNDSGQVIGWKQLSKTNASRDRLLITHGNGGCALDRAVYARWLNQAVNCDVFILEYPGYGARPGSPNQQTLFQAADEAIALLEKDGPLYVIGESLGTGVAAYLAGTHPHSIAGLLLIAPYHNLSDVAQHHMSILPARWILKDKFPSAAYLRNYHGRVAVLLAGQDTVVPNQFGHQLYDAYAGPKKLWEVLSASHDTLAGQPPEWWKELFVFWKE